MSSSVASFPECSATCPRVADLEKENEELREELAVKEERNERLRNKLRKYENPHQPSSQKRGTTKSKNGGDENDDGGSEDISNEKDGSSQEKHSLHFITILTKVSRIMIGLTLNKLWI